MSDIEFKDLIESPEGWINDGFIAAIRGLKTGTSQFGDWTSGFLYNPDNHDESIHFFASRNLEGMESEKFHIYGKGLKMEIKDGKKSVKCGSKVLWEPIGAMSPTGGQNASQGPSNASQAVSGSREESIYKQVAFKEACENYRALIASKAIKDFTVDQETRWIWDCTSRLYRILKVVIDGKLAPRNEFEGAELPDEISGEGEEL